MKHNCFPLRLTDRVLLNPDVPPRPKLVLAGTLGYPNLDPSLDQLDGDLPMALGSIHKAQTWLEEHGLVVLDRPEHTWERLPGSPRFNRSTRVERLASHADPRIPDAWVTELPARVMTLIRTEGGATTNAPFRPLLALLQAREQRRTHAILLPTGSPHGASASTPARWPPCAAT